MRPGTHKTTVGGGQFWPPEKGSKMRGPRKLIVRPQLLQLGDFSTKCRFAAMLCRRWTLNLAIRSLQPIRPLHGTRLEPQAVACIHPRDSAAAKLLAVALLPFSGSEEAVSGFLLNSP